MIPRRVLVVMAVGCGLSVANLYYGQPLLVEMARDLGIPGPRMGVVATLAQVGYALGILLLVPLGDRLERRGFIVVLLGAVTVALAAVAASPGFAWLAVASLVMGITTVVPQLIVPYAAGLAAPEERGRAVGTVMSGLLVGILVARTVGGFVGTRLGWRAMYAIAAALMVGLAAVVRAVLPRSTPSTSGITYAGLLRSLVGLVRDEPVLRQSCLFGSLAFAAFSAFWTTLALLLAGPPYGYRGDVVGLFGLVGAVGALAAPAVGRVADRRSPRTTIGFGLAAMLLSFVVFGAVGTKLWGLVAGVLLLDVGVQGSHISNQSRIFRLQAGAHSRLNTVYMVAYFVGGAIGSAAGTYAWGLGGWGGVCLVGAGFLIAALVGFAATAERTPARHEPAADARPGERTGRPARP